METPAAAPAEEFKSPKTLFKLINPGGNPFGGGQQDRFKPSSSTVNLVMPNSAPPPVPLPAPKAKAPTGESPDIDAKVLARMEYLFKIDKRVSELEDENDLLLKMVNRLKAENETLKTENTALKAK